MRIDWIQGNNDWGKPEGLWTITGDYGFFHVYAFTMTLGVILAILIAAYRFWKKDLNLIDLAIAAAVIVPFSLFGASVFGKLNANGIGQNAGGVGFWGLFAFWDEGMSIHGGVYTGFIVGAIIFGIISRKTKVSLWVYADCIVPNILLAQAIGRFGNLFNHEVMGVPIWDVDGGGTNPVGWLANWILVNTQMQYTGPDVAEPLANGVKLISGHIYQMSPIFIYEVIGFTIGWGILTFIVPNIGKWIGPKPWKKYPKRYIFDFKKTLAVMFQPWKWKEPYSKENQTWTGIWNSAYYLQKDRDEITNFELKLNEIKKSKKNRVTQRYQKMRVLNHANNPDRYWITKAGAQGAGYFFIWNFVRFFLELERPDNHLFVMYQKDLSLGLILGSAIIGLIFAVLSQTIWPMFFRQPGWIYEKQYFKAKRIKY